MNEKVAIILAHPDDAELRCYGTICKYIDEGKKCHLLIMSSGEHGIAIKDETNVTSLLEYNLRERETLAAFSNLNIKLIFLHQKDGYMQYGRDLIHTIEKVLMRIQPEILITHYPDLYGADHQDHTAVGKSVLNCSSRIQSVKKILLCDPLKSVRSHFVPNYFVDITQYYEKKKLALKCQKSQSGRFYLQDDFHRIKGLYYSANVSYADAENGHIYEAYELYWCCE